MLAALVIPVMFADELLWTPRNLPTDLMVGSLYLAMGIIMVRVAGCPNQHKGFIDFLIVANTLHALVMVVFAQKPSHIFLDAGFIGATGLLPLALYPWPLGKFLSYNRPPEG